MKPRFSSSAVLAFTLLLTNARAEWRLTIDAGEYERRGTIVTLQAPEKLRGNFALRADGVDWGALQVEETGRATFIVPHLTKGERKTLRVEPLSAQSSQVVAEKSGSVLKIVAQCGERPLFHYQMEPGPLPAGVPEHFRHGGYLHPLFTPGKAVVTADYSPDHRWHRGVWMAWTKTKFEGRAPDFWNMGKDGRITAETRFAELKQSWSGPVHAGFVSRHQFIDHTSGTAKEVLHEQWEVCGFALPRENVVDLISTQTCAGDSPLHLPKYHYGGLGVRGTAEWDKTVTMLTSNGDDRRKGDGTKARWVQLSGPAQGRTASLAVLIHPENFRFPQPLRLNPDHPQICIAPSRDGEWEIIPGKPLVSRYRLITTDEPADAAFWAARWQDYATPPAVELREE